MGAVELDAAEPAQAVTVGEIQEARGKGDRRRFGVFEVEEAHDARIVLGGSDRLRERGRCEQQGEERGGQKAMCGAEHRRIIDDLRRSLQLCRYPPFMQTLLRILLIAGLIGAVVLAGSAWIARNDRLRAAEAMWELEAEMQRRVAEHEAMIERLSRDHRLAHLHVVSQDRAADGSVLLTHLRFIEIDDDGREIARQDVQLPGAVIHVDALTIRFAREDVATGHPMRGRTLVLLRRLYSDALAPRDGVQLDVPGAIPPAYSGGDAAHFERQIWEEFWRLATDAERAAEAGVRVAQGESVYLPMEAGRAYELRVEAAGGMVLAPIGMSSLALTGSSGLDR